MLSRTVGAGLTVLALLVGLLLMGGVGTAGAASQSCGTVSLGHSEKAKVAISDGSVSCATVRSIAKRYDHPKKVKYYCHPADHVCEYGVYPHGWRCTGLFQGNFGCWLGGNARGEGSRASFSGTLVYSRSSRRSSTLRAGATENAPPARPSPSIEEASTRSCGSVVVQKDSTYDLHISKGTPPCSSVRRIAKRYGHPISKKPKYYCKAGYECLYSIYPEGWRCGGLFQGNFECWHGSNSPLRANQAFQASPSSTRMAIDLAARRPACTRRALTRGLRRGGLASDIEGDSFECAGHFAYAFVVVHHDGTADGATVLFRAGHGNWHPVSRARFCEGGEVPKKIYKPACETN